MEPVLRPATRHDLEAVEALVIAAYSPWIARIGRRPGPMLDDYSSRIARGEAQVLEDMDGIVGLLVMIPERDALLVDNVAVAPGAQGRGHGRRLMAAAEAAARARRLPCLRLYTHAKMTENVALYARLGFGETRRVTENGFDRVYMEKPLGPRLVQSAAP